jgi:hypothetical protein
MSKTADICYRRVDAFVAAANSAPRETLLQYEVPPECVISTSDEGVDWVDWHIVPSNGAPWLPEVETSLRFRLPASFRSLLARYLFPSFEVGPLFLYSVGVRDPKSTGEEFRYAIFDAIMFPFLLDKGLLRFAQPQDWSYDPVCFDFRNANRKSEPGVVRVDHEEILCNDRLRVIETISPAFRELMEDMTRSLRNKSDHTTPTPP